jgi:hypothetical protein
MSGCAERNRLSTRVREVDGYPDQRLSNAPQKKTFGNHSGLPNQENEHSLCRSPRGYDLQPYLPCSRVTFLSESSTSGGLSRHGPGTFQVYVTVIVSFIHRKRKCCSVSLHSRYLDAFVGRGLVDVTDGDQVVGDKRHHRRVAVDTFGHAGLPGEDPPSDSATRAGFLDS